MRASFRRIPLDYTFESVTTLEAKKLIAMADAEIDESVPTSSMMPPDPSVSTSGVFPFPYQCCND